MEGQTMARILLVDDNIELLNVMSLVLISAGHQLHAVANGRDAMRSAEKNGFDLVITDIFMPEKDGLEVITALREKFPGIPVLAISGGIRLDALEYLEIARKLGAVQVLSKPFTTAQLLESVGQLN